MDITKFSMATVAKFQAALKNGTLDKGTIYLVTENGGLEAGTTTARAELYIGSRHIVDVITEDETEKEVVAHALANLDERLKSSHLTAKDIAYLLVTAADTSPRLLEILKALRQRVGTNGTSPIALGIVPRYVGDLYFTINGSKSELWFSTGLTVNDWHSLIADA